MGAPHFPDGSCPQQETGLVAVALAWAPEFVLWAAGPRVWNRFIR